MISPEKFLTLISREPNGSEPMVRMGTIPPSYTTGRPTIIFDGETVASGKAYPYLSSYAAPAAGHRVLLLRAGHAWVIVGRII